MLGKDILVAPIVEEGLRLIDMRKIPDTWYDFNNQFKLVCMKEVIFHESLECIPVYFRAGGIICLYNIEDRYFASTKDLKKIPM